MRKIINPFLFVTLSLLALSCAKGTQSIHVTGITLNCTSLELIEGETADLVATISPKDADNRSIIWSSTNGSVASVNNGKVTALKVGTTTITAKSDDGGFTASCSVNVAPKTIAVSSIVLSKSQLSLVVGDSETITATIKPDDATDKTVTWSSSDAAVATVEGGKVTAVKEGSTIISAKAGDKTATCSVTVEKKVIPVESVELSQTDIELERGTTETLVATVKPDDATDKTVTWSSSNSAVASVDQNGNVSALKEGTATITVTTTDGSKKATCKVTVRVPVESISLNKNELTLYLGSSETLSATVKPDDATDKTITWVSMNPSVATVDASGKIAAIQIGETKIIAKSGKETAECHVIVIPIPVSSITLSETSLKMKIGDSKRLTATINPDNATDKTVTWESSDASIVTVSSNGLVTAIKKGNATIIARSSQEGVYASCEVQVLDDDSNVGGNDMNYDNGDF